MKYRRISVGEIERLLHYLEEELSGYRIPESILREGQWIHMRLGYNQPEIFKRFLFVEDELWLIGGAPDLIDESGNIRELKTYRDGKRKGFLLEVGKTQANIYCWLTGLPRYCVDLYSIPEQKVTDSVCFDYDESKAVEDIKRAIERKKSLEKLRESLRSGSFG